MSIRPVIPEPEEVMLTGLEAKGRTQFFHHHPDYELPVRDFTYRRKTEPYIEYGYEQGRNDNRIIGAENFCNKCVPHAICSFLTAPEKFLFLVTNPQVEGYHEKQIVGYLRKEDFEDRGGWFAVIGEVRLYRFQDAYPSSALDKIIQRSEITVGSEKTEEILDHFAACEDVTMECVELVVNEKEMDPVSQISNSGCGAC